MTIRLSGLLISQAITLVCAAQTLVPYTTNAERFGVFHPGRGSGDGRFEELEPRKPTAIFPTGDRLAYITQDGELRAYIDGRPMVLQRGEQVEVKTSRGMLAWKLGEQLRVVRSEGPMTICRDVGAFTVHDSLVVYHNEMDRTMDVYWRGISFPLADVLMESDAPQWSAGSNTLTYFDRDARQVVLFYRGATQILCYGADYGRVSTGGDVVAYMDDNDDTFRVFDRNERIDLEPFAPADFRAGLGLVGYTSATGALRCYSGHKVYNLADFAPTAYYVQDSVITWVESGQWKTLNAGKVEIIERYVPENWQVSGAFIAYQDLNRELRIYHRGRRIIVTEEAGVKRFELHGDAVVWQSNSGTVKVWWKGRVYEKY